MLVVVSCDSANSDSFSLLAMDMNDSNPDSSECGIASRIVFKMIGGRNFETRGS